MQLTEKQIIDKIRKSNIEAYKYLFELYYKDLFLFAKKFIPNREVAEEIVQDIFIHFWENRTNLNISTSLKSYLYTSVKNRSLNYLKSKFNKIDFTQIDEANNHSSGLSAEKILILDELDELIVKAIEILPLRCKEIFHLSRNSGMTYQEIADLLDVSKETVKSQISDALKRIKVYLDIHWNDIPLKDLKNQ